MTTTRREIRRLSCAALGDPPWDPPAPPTRSALPSSSDIVIVGAGLTGLAAAVALAAAHRDVVVLEQSFGEGATSRSGGVVLGDTLVGPSPQFERCDRSLREWIEHAGVACDPVWAGCLELLRDTSLPPDPIDWRDEGAIRLSRKVAGGVLDPSKLLGGLAAAAVRAGVRIVDGSAVAAIDDAANGVVIETSQGPLSAHHAILAMDAMLAPGGTATPADPWDERAITVAMQTMPLDAESVSELGLSPHQAFYTDDLPLLWGRVMPDRSLLVGREMLPALSEAPSPALTGLVAAAGARLLARTRGLHPAVAGIAMKRAWGGPIVRTAAGIPLLGRDAHMTHVTWAGGYGGHGIAQAFRVGTLVAEQLLRGSSSSDF